MMKDELHMMKNLKDKTLAILGIPSDENSSFLRGTASAPSKIREALRCGSANMWTELGVDLEKHAELIDLGDLQPVEGVEAYLGIQTQVQAILEQQTKLLTLGGDHAVTYPILKAYAQQYPNLHILHFDAHADLYQDFEGNPYSHASPFCRILEEKLCSRLTQVGIRTLNAHQRQQADRFQVEIIEAKDFNPHQTIQLEGPVYISLDLDVFDPAFAPGVSHHEPGGLSVRDVLRIIHNIKNPIVGADIVELNPTRDRHNQTAMVAAKFLKEIAGKILQDGVVS